MKGEAFNSLKLSFVWQQIRLDHSIWSLKNGRLKNMKNFTRGEYLDFENKGPNI